MGAGSVFVLLVVIVVAVIIAVAFFGFGASQWKRETDVAPEERGEDQERPTHKVLDEKGDLVREEYEDAPRRDS